MSYRLHFIHVIISPKQCQGRAVMKWCINRHKLWVFILTHTSLHQHVHIRARADGCSFSEKKTDKKPHDRPVRLNVKDPAWPQGVLMHTSCLSNKSVIRQLLGLCISIFEHIQLHTSVCQEHKYFIDLKQVALFCVPHLSWRDHSELWGWIIRAWLWTFKILPVVENGQPVDSGSFKKLFSYSVGSTTDTSSITSESKKISRTFLFYYIYFWLIYCL